MAQHRVEVATISNPFFQNLANDDAAELRIEGCNLSIDAHSQGFWVFVIEGDWVVGVEQCEKGLFERSAPRLGFFCYFLIVLRGYFFWRCGREDLFERLGF